MLVVIKRYQKYIVHHSLLGLHSCRPVRVSMLTIVHYQRWVIRTSPWRNGRKWPCLMYQVIFCILFPLAMLDCHKDLFCYGYIGIVLYEHMRTFEPIPNNDRETFL